MAVDISLRGVTKRFGKVTAVSDLTLDIAAGEFHTFLGPSGCGKTTTLRMIAGLEDPDNGEIFIGGRCVYSSQKRTFIAAGDRNVGFAFQNYALWPHMTVHHNIAFGLREQGVSRGEARKRVAEILDKFGLAGYQKRYPAEISGGEQQRVALARTVVAEPEVLLMDEPISHLDAKLRMRLRSELKRLHEDMGASTVYVTHDQVEAIAMSDRVSLMKDGSIQQTAPPMDLYNRPTTLFTADFMGNPQINKIDGQITSHMGRKCFISTEGQPAVRVYVEGQGSADGARVKLVAHPEWLALSSVEVADATEMSVYSVLPIGPETLVYLNCGDLVFVAREPGQVTRDSDDRVWVKFTDYCLYDQDGALLQETPQLGSWGA